MTIGYKRFATWIFVRLRSLTMTTIDGSDSPQYFVYRPPPDNLSRRQLDDYFQGVFVADIRSVFALVNNLQKQIAELQLNKSNTIVSPSPSTPSTILLTPSPAPGPPISSCTPAATSRLWKDPQRCVFWWPRSIKLPILTVSPYLFRNPHAERPRSSRL